MLRIKNLEKSYGKFKALDNLNLEIEKGEIFGFIGPNGAGKSTTMKIITGLLSPDSGEVYVNDIDAIKDNKKIKDEIGYMPEFFASIYGITGDSVKKLSMELLELVNLTNKYDSYVDGLSRGMKQRLCLARCLIHNPKFLILDEPASGMDPKARFEMKNILKNLKDMGKTILVSSHILSELGEICTDIGIIEKGHMVCQGKVDEIMNRVSGNYPIVINILNSAEKAVKILKENPKIEKVNYEENKVIVYFNGNDEETVEVLKSLVVNDVPVISFNKQQHSLEDVFMKITNEVGGENNEN